MRAVLLALCVVFGATLSAHAVSVGQLISDCGDDSERYCQGVGYGEPMQVCLNQSYQKLEPQCKAVMDRLNDGEGVTLF